MSPPPVLHWRGLRNLNDFQRVEIARKLECAVRARAKAASIANLKQNSDVESLPPRYEGKSRDKLGKMANVSGKTYEHAATVLDRAPPRKPVDERKQETGIISLPVI